jgi:hypothetical protein
MNGWALALGIGAAILGGVSYAQFQKRTNTAYALLGMVLAVGLVVVAFGYWIGAW